MAKSLTKTFYFRMDSTNASDEIQKLCEEFPEVKLVKVDIQATNTVVYFTIKFPVKLRPNIALYVQQHDIRGLDNG